MANEQSRNWFIRVTKSNNTKQGLYDYDFDELYKTLVDKYSKVIMAVHDKDLENIHCHIVLQNTSAVRFSTLKKLIPYGDIEKQRGTNEECYQYVLHKDSKSKENEKIEYDESCIKTNIENLQDWLKVDERSRTDLVEFKNAILLGLSRKELIDQFPTQMIRYSNFYNVCRSAKMESDFSNKTRDIKVTYIYGGGGIGKTHYVYEENEFDYSKVYSVDDYSHPFDNYNGEDVLLLDEYRSNFSITYILKLLDKYPLRLKARYENKIACYTKVYVVSNIPLTEQYKGCDYATRQALMRRFNSIKHFTGFGVYEEMICNNGLLYKIEDNTNTDDIFK